MDYEKEFRELNVVTESYAFGSPAEIQAGADWLRSHDAKFLEKMAEQYGSEAAKLRGGE